jgi:mannose-1-phosphate guanylyltransferase
MVDHTKISAETSIDRGLMKAVMLVGGFGTRLRPLTLAVKKELMPVANRPFLEHVLAHLAKHGVDEAILTTGYLAEAFADFPAERAHGVKLTIVKEEEPLDTCGAVKNVEHLLDGTFLVLNGDIFTSLDITGLVAYHRERETLGTLTLKPVDDPSAYGLVPIDDDGRIERFIEKPSPEEIVTNLINAGTYVLEPEVLNYVPVGEPFSFERPAVGGLFPLLLAEGEALYGYVSDSYWLDIGTPAKYLKANRDALDGLVGISPPGIEQARGVFVGRSTDIDPSAHLVAPCVLGDGVRIGRGATIGPNTSLGDGVQVGGGASVSSSTLHERVTVGNGATITDSILAAGVHVGSGTELTGGVIGEGVQIGADNELRDGIRLWPGIEVPDRGITFTR